MMEVQQNICWIVIDQLRADCLIGALADYVPTPNLDRLMDDACVFTNHHSAISPCGPSRASMLTGKYGFNHGAMRNGTPLAQDSPNIARFLREIGYDSMLFGYTDITQDPRFHAAKDPIMQDYEQVMPGFHEVVEMRQGKSFPWRADLIEKGYNCPKYQDFYQPVTLLNRKLRFDDAAFYSAQDSDTAFLTNQFLKYMKAYTQQPWFAHLTYIRPHPPFVCPAPYNKSIDPTLLPVPIMPRSRDEEMAVHPFSQAYINTSGPLNYVQGFDHYHEPLSLEHIQMIRAQYLGLLHEVDVHIGKVIDFLKTTQQYDNTLLIITSDHGEMLGDYHMWGKGSFYPQAYHTPLIMRIPQYQKSYGKKINLPTQSIDIAPTILSWANFDKSYTMDGRSLLTLMNDQSVDNWRTYHINQCDYGSFLAKTDLLLNTNPRKTQMMCIEDDQYRLIFFAGDLPALLFDKQRNEAFENVANLPEYQSQLLKMTRLMNDHWLQYFDPSGMRDQQVACD